MLQLTPQSRIFLALQPVDFRKGIDGLAALCRQALAVKYGTCGLLNRRQFPSSSSRDAVFAVTQMIRHRETQAVRF